MIKEQLLEIYIYFFEKIFNSNNKDLINKVWQKMKTNITLLDFAITNNDNNFTSKTIVYMILKDKTLYNTKIYTKLIKKIYNSATLAKEYVKNNSSNTFLMLTLENEDLKLNKEQKKFLIFEAEKCPYTEKYYKENKKEETSIHGTGILDIRYKILQNQSFSLQEKTNLFLFLYPDDEIKVNILNELEWEVAKVLGIGKHEKDYDGIYFLSNEDINKIIPDKNMQLKIINKINLCKSIKSKIPEEEIKNYRNND